MHQINITVHKVIDFMVKNFFKEIFTHLLQFLIFSHMKLSAGHLIQEYYQLLMDIYSYLKKHCFCKYINMFCTKLF